MLAYVTMAFEDGNGLHQVGDQIDLPVDAPWQKAGFERLVAFGILSTELPAPASEPEPEPEPPEPPAPAQQRRPRRPS